jgi:hypothetical protein
MKDDSPFVFAGILWVLSAYVLCFQLATAMRDMIDRFLTWAEGSARCTSRSYFGVMGPQRDARR